MHILHTIWREATKDQPFAGTLFAVVKSIFTGIALDKREVTGKALDEREVNHKICCPCIQTLVPHPQRGQMLFAITQTLRVRGKYNSPTVNSTTASHWSFLITSLYFDFVCVLHSISESLLSKVDFFLNSLSTASYFPLSLHRNWHTVWNGQNADTAAQKLTHCVTWLKYSSTETDMLLAV